MLEIEDLKKQIVLLSESLQDSKNNVQELEQKLSNVQQELLKSNLRIKDFSDSINFSIFEIYFCIQGSKLFILVFIEF